MRNSRLLSFLFLLGLFILGCIFVTMSGCGILNPTSQPATILQRTTQIEDTYTSVVNSLSDLQREGYITAAEHGQIEPIRVSVASQIDALRDQAKSGSTSAWSLTFSLVTNGLQQLSLYEATAQARKAHPSTQPSVRPATPTPARLDSARDSFLRAIRPAVASAA